MAAKGIGILIALSRRVLRRVLRPSRSGQPEGDDAFLAKIRGVIHVGANSGQERGTYDQHDLRVIWVEPNPQVFQILLENIRPFPRQRAFERLLADEDGIKHEFHVANNEGLSSSILELKLHRDIWPQVEYETTITIEATRLDSLLATEGIKPRAYDALVLDTQGSELLVLRGATRLLGHMRFVKVEVPDFESYAGCCRISDVESFLSGFGFSEYTRTLFAERNLSTSLRHRVG